MTFKHYVQGNEVGLTALKNNYDSYAPEVLSLHLRKIDRPRAQPKAGKSRGRRPPTKYKVIKDLPPPAEYQQLKMQKYETTVESLVADGYSEVECLAEEMRDWHDGMGENLQQSSNGEAVGEAADALENVNDPPEINEVLAALKLFFYPSLKISSRAGRAGEAASMLREASDAVAGHIADENLEEDDEDLASAYQEVADELANHADELESISFPGMYG